MTSLGEQLASENIQTVATILAVTFAGVGLLLNWRAIVSQSKISRAQKQIDVIMECNRRYVVASAKVSQLISENNIKTTRRISDEKLATILDAPLREYWSVYYEEWQYFSIGMVPKTFFKFWCTGLVRNFTAASLEGFGNIVLWEAWLRYGASSWGYTGPFVEHIQKLKEISELDETTWDKKIDEAVCAVLKYSKKQRQELGL